MNNCFVLMPFAAKYQEVYDCVIKPAAEEAGYKCERADELYGSTNIMNDVAKGIKKADVIIADLTGKNPNVFYELGASHALLKIVIIISQDEDYIPYDLRSTRVFIYKQTIAGGNELRQKLKDQLEHAKKGSITPQNPFS